MCVGRVGTDAGGPSLLVAADGTAEVAAGTADDAADGDSAPPLRRECASAVNASASAEATESQPAPRMTTSDSVPSFEHDQNHDQRKEHHGREYGGRQPRQVVVLEPPSAHEVAAGDLSLGTAESASRDEVLDAGHVRLLDVDHPGRISEDG